MVPSASHHADQHLDVGGDATRKAVGQTGQVVAAIILIGLGVFFLFWQVFDLPGGGLFLTLGAAFLIARVATGQYGFAVPAGVLLGFGSFIAMQQAGVPLADGGGWYFLLLGAGFLAVYVIGARWELTWPFYPAIGCAAFGLLLIARPYYGVLGQLAWLSSLWPLVLVGIGVWLLLRDRVPAEARKLVGVVGITLIIVYGILALMAVFADPVAAGASYRSWGIGR